MKRSALIPYAAVAALAAYSLFLGPIPAWIAWSALCLGGLAAAADLAGRLRKE